MTKAFTPLQSKGRSFRKLLFQFHLWVGIGVGLWVCLISVTGVALIFRAELEDRPYAEISTPQAGPRVGLDSVAASVRASYPGFDVTEIKPPTTSRNSFLVRVVKEGDSRKVYADKTAGRILGEIPKRSFFSRLENLHTNLLAGRVGQVINLAGSAALCFLGVSGAILWGSGARRWWRGLFVDFRRNWRRNNWELHQAIGFWVLVPLMMWAITGTYFLMPNRVRDLVAAAFPTSPRMPLPSSNFILAGPTNVNTDELVAEAERQLPGSRLSAVFPAVNAHDPLQVMVAHAGAREFIESDHTYFFFDPSDGRLLKRWDPGIETTGDKIMPWVPPVHYGRWGGTGIKLIWFILGLVPPCLFITGVIMWWNRTKGWQP